MQFVKIFSSVIFGTVLGFIVSIFVRNHLAGFLTRYSSCSRTHNRHLRPRSLHTELHSTELVFIGVMTASKYLDTRANAVYKTWGRKVPGKIKFFMSDNKTLDSVKLPIVILPGIQDNEYPPQKKVMAMLRHMHDHYIEKFKWFMRADDDVYVRPGKLRTFLAALDSSVDTVLGQGGVGIVGEENKLGLIKNECYCLGGPGVIISRNVLRKITPNIEHCLKDSISTHEDVELGRCIRKFAGVSCLWAKEAVDLFQQVYKDQSNAYHGTLNTPKINNAITLHPVKEPGYMFRLHVHFLSLRLRSLQHNIFKNDAILKMTKKAALSRKKKKKKKTANMLSFRARNTDLYHQSNTSSMLHWEYLTTTKHFHLQGQNVRSLPNVMRLALKKAMHKTMHDLDRYDAESLGPKKRRPIQLIDIQYGYRQVNPKLGVQFVFAFSTKSQDVRLEFPWTPRKPTFHRKQVQQAFSEIQGDVLKNSLKLHETVHFIVPLKGKLEAFEYFLENLHRAFLVPGEKIAVLIVYFPGQSSPERHIEIYNKYVSEFPETKLLWKNLEGKFNRAKALQNGVSHFGNNSLLFFSDVDLVFKNEFVYTCRSNTIRGQQAYFPIMFSQFNRNISYFGKIKPNGNFIYTKTAGLWRIYSFGPVCIYADDVITAGGLDTTINGWGTEDIDFANKVFNSGLEFFRTPDPGIVHVFHVHAPCNETATGKQYEMCQNSLVSTYAPMSGLVNYMMAKNYIK